jgi:transposase
VSERKACRIDLTDVEWVVIELLIAAWKAGHPSASSHQGRYGLRKFVNVLWYQNRTFCQWELLPTCAAYQQITDVFA